MIKRILQESTVLLAFVLLGALLLLSVWMTLNVRSQLFEQFRHSQVSVLLKGANEGSFKNLVEKSKEVIRYKIFTGSENRDRLTALYPELSSVLKDLDARFFPDSALVTVKSPQNFLKLIESNSQNFEGQIVHQPPIEFSRFLWVLSAIILSLWLLTLSVVIYFNLERLSLRDGPKWSLMKMLGARPSQLFGPLFLGQSLRVVASCFVAIVLASLAANQIQSFFPWNWSGFSFFIWGSFFVASLVITAALSFGLFHAKYKEIALG